MWRRLTGAFWEGVRELSPAYFALVMATGIVSIACHLLGMDFLAYPLFYLNQFFYAVLWLFTLARLARFSSRMVADLCDHGRGVGFLTLVAGTNVLGSQFVLLASDQRTALTLWIVGLLLWLFLIFAFFTVMTIKEQKPTLEMGINGAWMLTVVSTQSVAVLGTLVAGNFAAWQEAFFFALLCFYLLGCMFYILIISLILYRFMFFKFDPQAMTPPYWINMGAIAITTLAGANLLLKGNAGFLISLAPFIKGFTLFFWAAGTWWIPLLLLLGAWRHIYKHFPLTYNPLYWGMVFPMGMYTACTYQLSKAMELPFLLVIPRFFIYLALFAWAAVLAGLLHSQVEKAIQVMRGPAEPVH